MADIVMTRNVTFAVFCVGFLFFLIGFSAPNWIKYTGEDNGGYYHEGLWKKCWDIGIGKHCRSHDPDFTVSKVKATQANMCLALCLLMAALAGYIYWFTRKASYIRQHGMTDVGRVTLYLSAGGGCFNFLAILIYGFYWINYGEYLDWAYILSVFSAIIFTFCGFTAVCLADFGPGSSQRTTSAGATEYPGNVDPGVQVMYPPTNGAPHYVTNQIPDQAISIVYQPELGQNQSMYGQPPAYSTEQQPPPTYQQEWQTKGNQETNLTEQLSGSISASLACDQGNCAQIGGIVGNTNMGAEFGDVNSPPSRSNPVYEEVCS